MEQQNTNSRVELKKTQPVENDYSAHDNNPAPSEEAVVERNEEGAGKAMKWVIPIFIAIGLIAFLIWYLNQRN